MSEPRPRILIVDDEEAILETMSFTFEDDYDVLTAASAPAALELLAKESPVAAVITDQRMPDMTGVEFLGVVCDRHPNTTRIILTGFADGDAMVGAINQGHVYAYVTKPWEPDDLKRLVHRAVELHQLREQNDRLLVNLQEANVFLAAAIDEIPMGALVIDAAGTVRATNRSAREYLGLESDPSGCPLADVLAGAGLGGLRSATERLGGEDETPYEELDLVHGATSLRLRVAVRRLGASSASASDPASDGPAGSASVSGRVVVMREISHEPLRRRFEELLRELCCTEGEMRGPLERAQQELGGFAESIKQSGVATPGMAELDERVSRTLTAIQNWLSVDEALSRESFPDARLLLERMRMATSRWPHPDEIPDRVRELARRVEDYYDSGDNSGQPVL